MSPMVCKVSPCRLKDSGAIMLAPMPEVTPPAPPEIMVATRPCSHTFVLRERGLMMGCNRRQWASGIQRRALSELHLGLASCGCSTRLHQQCSSIPDNPDATHLLIISVRVNALPLCRRKYLMKSRSVRERFLTMSSAVILRL